MIKLHNTPEKIVTWQRGAKFYCVECRKTYQKCKCRVYQSADTLKHGKSYVPENEAEAL